MNSFNIGDQLKVGASFWGWNNFEFANNSMSDCDFSLLSSSVGVFDNNIQCNETESVINDLIFLGNNNGTEFINNNFHLGSFNNADENVYIWDNSSVKASIGSSDAPSGNEFEACVGYPGIEFGTSESSQEFLYVFSYSIPCHEPVNPANYIKIASDNPLEGCENGVGVYSS